MSFSAEKEIVKRLHMAADAAVFAKMSREDFLGFAGLVFDRQGVDTNWDDAYRRWDDLKKKHLSSETIGRIREEARAVVAQQEESSGAPKPVTLLWAGVSAVAPLAAEPPRATGEPQDEKALAASLALAATRSGLGLYTPVTGAVMFARPGEAGITVYERWFAIAPKG